MQTGWEGRRVGQTIETTREPEDLPEDDKDLGIEFNAFTWMKVRMK